ncbi:MAG TPA: hypothetical protein VL832_11405 [Puia sp.]|jgi:hypothetical protein|nr:hypothetical protein [Puia sp.]
MKKILFIIFLAPIFSCGRTQTPATVKGTITYFFNKYQGDKPDIGSKVWIVEKSSVPDFNKDLFDTAYHGSVNRSFAAFYKSSRMPIPDNIVKSLKNYRADNETTFKDIDKRNAMQLLQISSSQKAKKATVDGAGNYSFSVDPGIYYVLIQSNGRTGSTMTDIMGKQFVQVVSIKVGETSDVSHKFDQY